VARHDYGNIIILYVFCYIIYGQACNSISALFWTLLFCMVHCCYSLLWIPWCMHKWHCYFSMYNLVYCWNPILNIHCFISINLLTIVMELELNCTCGVGPMRLLISRTYKNYMRHFYKCLLARYVFPSIASWYRLVTIPFWKHLSITGCFNRFF
jgi:hypothetical protein